jgi:DNA/RNA endonuclease G (NUC1)
MFPNSFRSFRFAVCAVVLAACASDGVVSPGKHVNPNSDQGPVSPTGGVVISQVYGGGGNSGATYTNDYIELYNAGTTDVALDSWSVQYASAGGTSWQVTSLSGTIASGHYYLVQENAGAGGTTPLPTPNATGSISMSGTAGKVALVNSTTALSGTGCPTMPSSVVDYVGYGTSANCYEGTGPTPAPSNTMAVFRTNDGATDTNDNSADFVRGAPNPRNSAAAPPTNGTPASIAISPSTWSLKPTQTKTFIATAKDKDGTTVATTIRWTSSNPEVATIDPSSGVATGVKLGSVTITATSSNDISSSATLTVVAGEVRVQALDGTLPVGFQSQLFVSSGSTDAAGNPVTSSNVTWSSADPSTVSVDEHTGVVTAHAAGSTSITATAQSDGTSAGSATVVTAVAAVGPDARIGHNTELGVPTDADPSDDVIIARRQYTLSYNAAHHGPNWVSWNLDASHKGSTSRCNCFTADTALTRLGLHAYDTNDWINGGVYSRGHMAPSADWADAPGDNAPTFFLSNMLPQNQTMNSGAWGDLENALRDTAVGNTEIYIIAGPIFTRNRSGPGVDGLGYTNGTGHIAVPDSIWKVAVVVHDARSAGQMTSTSDVDVIAVNMANNATSVGPWENFTTTVDAIQKSTGYNLLAMLPDSVEKIVEANDHPPVAMLTAGTTTVAAGQPVAVSGTFTDPDGRTDAPWSMTFDWGDGTFTRTNILPYPAGTVQYNRSHSYAAAGTYTVRLTVRDKYGASSYSEATITVQ